jgi:hypothetical protein
VRSSQSLREISYEVVGILDPDTHPDKAIRNTSGRALGGGEMRM